MKICPYCKQGCIMKAKVKKNGMLIHICDECDTVWIYEKEKISNMTGIGFDKFMEMHNCIPSWNELDFQA